MEPKINKTLLVFLFLCITSLFNSAQAVCAPRDRSFLELGVSSSSSSPPSSQKSPSPTPSTTPPSSLPPSSTSSAPTPPKSSPPPPSTTSKAPVPPSPPKSSPSPSPPSTTPSAPSPPKSSTPPPSSPPPSTTSTAPSPPKSSPPPSTTSSSPSPPKSSPSPPSTTSSSPSPPKSSTPPPSSPPPSTTSSSPSPPKSSPPPPSPSPSTTTFSVPVSPSPPKSSSPPSTSSSFDLSEYVNPAVEAQLQAVAELGPAKLNPNALASLSLDIGLGATKITDPQIKTLCDKTGHGPLCLAVIAPFYNGKSDLYSLVDTVTKTAIEQTKKVMAMVDTMATDPKFASIPKVADRFAECKSHYEDALDNMNEAIGAIGRRDPGTITTMVSAAISDYDSCDGEFTGQPNPIPDGTSPMADIDQILMDTADIILGIANRIH
ncbi:Pectinesterase inhibitor [Corchorus olitorius]|uniref:Pectinesterase inhibitor n=1 Tax=Corchorus olitorius TaxID=93759 RepID=A0A1R3GK45_9ROSI|nr:Pectinesterase inhibitor [Corchorus olitorius]